MRHNQYLIIILIIMISCKNKDQIRTEKEKKLDESQFLSDTITKYYPFLTLFDSMDTLGLERLEATGLNDSSDSLIIVYEKYKANKEIKDFILNQMNDFDKDSLERDRFFISSFDKDYLKIDIVERLKLDIEFYKILGESKNILHIGYYGEKGQFFISIDTVLNNIYCNYQR